MTVKLYAFTCGTVTGEFGRLMEGGEGDITLPVPVFLIEHPKGRALFDTGLHPDCQRDPTRRLGTRLAGLFRIGFQPGEEVSARLEAIDRDPGTIDLVINSHFHFDHVGGNALIPNATMLVQRREWDAGMDADTAARHGYNPRDFDLGHALRLLDGEYDVFGDGSVVCLPTHGHTPGHSVYVVESKGQKLVLWGDLMHVAAVQFIIPDVTIAFDVDPKAAAVQRKKAYAQAAKEGYLVGSAHLPFPGLGRLRAEGKGYAFVPVDYMPVK